MWSVGVVVLLPSLNGGAGMRQTGASMDGEACVAELPIKTLYVPVLAGFPRLDELQGHAVRISPGIQHLACKLRPVVDGDLSRRSTPRHELVENPRHPLAWQRGVDLNRQALPADNIEDVESAEAPTSAKVSSVKSIAHASPRRHGCAGATRGIAITCLRLLRRTVKPSAR